MMKRLYEILAQFLRKKGYEVFTAGSGESALDILSNESIDLVVTDIKMPGISGVDLLKYINENQQTIPVLITTGFPTLDTAIEALKLGAYDYLTKPFHLEEIAEKVKRAIISKQLEEENLLFSKLVSLHEVTKILASTLEIIDLNHKFLDYSIKMSKADCGALLFSDSSGKMIISEIAGEGFDKSYWMGQPFVMASKWVASNEEPLLLESECIPFLRTHSHSLSTAIVYLSQDSFTTIGVLNLAKLAGRGSFSNLDLEIINVHHRQAFRLRT